VNNSPHLANAKGDPKLSHKLFTDPQTLPHHADINNIIQYMSYKIDRCWCRLGLEIDVNRLPLNLRIRCRHESFGCRHFRLNGAHIYCFGPLLSVCDLRLRARLFSGLVPIFNAAPSCDAQDLDLPRMSTEVAQDPNRFRIVAASGAVK
jgi:hypothetical protein